MAQHTGIVTSWDLPNFPGELYTADIVPGQEGVNPSFLTMIGGLNGANAKIVPDMSFQMSQEFDYPVAKQPSITESGSANSLPDPVNPITTNARNTCQIYQEAVEETYVSRSTRARLVTDQLYPTGAPTEGFMSEFSPSADLAALENQINYALARIARDVNYTFLNGTYQEMTNSGVAPKTRGILEGIVTNTVAASGAELSEKLLNTLFIKMVENSAGQAFGQMPVLIMSATQKTKLADLVIYAPESRTIGGYNIQYFETNFGPVSVMYEPTIASDTILFANLGVIKPVFNEVPGKGVLFYEPKEKVGASVGGMLYGHIGLDYGPEWMHGKITGLSTELS